MSPDEIGARLASAGTAAEAAELARRAEEDGRALVAIRAWQVALRFEPANPEALAALTVLYEELGDHARAQACRARVEGAPSRPPASLAEASPSFGGPPSDGAPAVDGAPDDGDLLRFLDRFGGREDTHARMWRSGDQVGWGPVPSPLTIELLREHVRGVQTLGVYCVGFGDTARFLCLDLDISSAARERVRGDAAGVAELRRKVGEAGLAMAGALRARGVDALLEDSGYKGRHLWVFLDGDAPAPEVYELARRLGQGLAPVDPDLCVEAFPRQPGVRPDGLGSLLKLPLGVHLRTGRRALLLDAAGGVDPEPWTRLRRCPRYGLLQLQARLAGLLVDAPLPVMPDGPPRPAPAPQLRPWTEGDFESSRTVAPVLRGCAVLREVVRAVLGEGRLDHAAAVVLSHSLGHLPDGPRAVNYLYDRVPGVAPGQRMGAPHRGSPISCARVRQRLPAVVDVVPCECTFHLPPGGYAHPLCHLGELPPAPPPRAGLDEALDRYTRALEHTRRVEAELAAARREAVELLSRSPDGRWRVEGGEWALREQAGEPCLTWVPDGGGE